MQWCAGNATACSPPLASRCAEQLSQPPSWDLMLKVTRAVFCQRLQIHPSDLSAHPFSHFQFQLRLIWAKSLTILSSCVAPKFVSCLGDFITSPLQHRGSFWNMHLAATSFVAHIVPTPTSVSLFWRFLRHNLYPEARGQVFPPICLWNCSSVLQVELFWLDVLISVGSRWLCFKFSKLHCSFPHSGIFLLQSLQSQQSAPLQIP